MLRTAIVVFNVCSFIKASPFHLESSDCLRVRKYSARWKRLLWHVTNLMFYFAATFQITTYTYEIFTADKGNAFAIHTIYAVCSVFGIVFMLSLYMGPDLCILMLNQHDKLLGTIESKQ